MTEKASQTLNSGNSSLPECTRCEAMFRSKELYLAHRKLCFGGKDQTRYCKICGVKKESEWLMGKHLLEHCDMKNGRCMDCGWVSELMIEKETNPSPKLFSQILADIGSHLNEHHMIKSDDLTGNIKPKRNGFNICIESLKCIECDIVQDDIKSLQEHLKLCFKNAKARFFICYCEAEFSDRTLFDHHIRWFQCARKFHAKLIPHQPSPSTANHYQINKLDGKNVSINCNGILKDGLKRGSPPKIGDLYQPNKKCKIDIPSPSHSPDNLSNCTMNSRGVETELHCEKCNISFKKMETFKVHKENYCESRHANVEAIQAARAEKQREREEMKLVNKERTKNRTMLDAEENADWSQKPYPCPDCKIGFESKKHYNAHKSNYCPNRSSTDSINSNSPRSSSPNNLQQSNQLLQVAMMLSPAFNAATLLSQPNLNVLNPLAQSLAQSMKNQTLSQTIELIKAHSKLQNLKHFEASPLDLSSKKDELENEPDHTVAKVEEIESDCERDTRVSV